MDELEIYKIVNSVYGRFFKCSGVNYDDIIEEGVSGVISGLRRYDARLSKISTYAYNCAYYAMSKYIARERLHKGNISYIEEFEPYLYAKDNGIDKVDAIIELNELKELLKYGSMCYNVVSDIIKGMSRKEVAVKYNINMNKVECLWYRFCKKARRKSKGARWQTR